MEALNDVRGKINVIDLDEGARAKWREATKPVVDAYKSRAGDLGALLVDEAGKL